ncbi:hypothetical protein DFQ27_001197 [Actinomortierella ambigua]|uniref:Sucrase/ferredoxin-like-domain-containing protein n=1 Tax=Actinomortierella ambigua TaxID=1343610 RepID=A0A9P6U7X4_9FUNG|nr:hypothetical protein DFQ27_001197 [Actinomortierella ambigua]
MVIITIAVAMNIVQSLFNKAKSTAITAIMGEPEYPKDLPYVAEADCRACPNPCHDEDHPSYPSYLKMDTESPLINSMKPYTRHVLISTGAEDWVSHIDEDKASLAPYLDKAIADGQKRQREENPSLVVPRIVLTNSSRMAESWDGEGWQVIVLPDQIVVNNVTPEQCNDFFEAFLKHPIGTPLSSLHASNQANNILTEMQVEKDLGREDGQNSKRSTKKSETVVTKEEKTLNGNTKRIITTTTTTTSATIMTPSSSSSSIRPHALERQDTDMVGFHRHHVMTDSDDERIKYVTVGKTTFKVLPWLPRAAIMICSHKKRDKRCGITAAILKKEFKHILRNKNIYGDCEDDVEIWLISHIGGHKFAGNVIVHRREGQAIWYGRVDPCHCKAIVERTVLEGQVIKELFRGSMIGSFDHKAKIAW